MYKTLVLPIYYYCDFLLLKISNQDAESLQKLQNCAFKNMLKVDRLTPTLEIHNTLCMDTLHTRRYRHVATQVYKYLNEPCPSECSSMFIYVSSAHQVNTRLANTNNLQLPKMNLQATQRNIRHSGVQIWAQVPEQIKVSSSINVFKQNIKRVNFTI